MVSNLCFIYVDFKNDDTGTISTSAKFHPTNRCKEKDSCSNQFKTNYSNEVFQF